MSFGHSCIAVCSCSNEQKLPPAACSPKLPHVFLDTLHIAGNRSYSTDGAELEDTQDITDSSTDTPQQKTKQVGSNLTVFASLDIVNGHTEY